jgi:hypothetical protein
MKLEKLTLDKFTSLENGELNTVIGGATTFNRTTFAVANGQVTFDTTPVVDRGNAVNTGTATSINGVSIADS